MTQTLPCGCFNHDGGPYAPGCSDMADEATESDRLRTINADMLAALKKITNNWNDLHPKDLQQARAAIARATQEG